MARGSCRVPEPDRSSVTDATGAKQGDAVFFASGSAASLTRPVDGLRAHLGKELDLIETGAYPQLAALAGEAGLQALWRDVWAATRDEGRFERNLARILDGVAADLGVP